MTYVLLAGDAAVSGAGGNVGGGDSGGGGGGGVETGSVTGRVEH